MALIEATQMRHYHEKLNFLLEGGRWCSDKEVGLDGIYLTYFPFSPTIEMQQMLPYHKKLLEVHIINKSLCLRLVTAEVHVKSHRMLVTTLLQNLVTELASYLIAEDTLLLEV